MAGDEERLIVLVEARLNDLEKQMKRGSDVTTREFGKMRRTGKGAMDAMEQDVQRSTSRINQALAASSTKIGAYGKAFAGGLVGGIAAGGIMGIVTQITEISNGIAKTGDEARRAGLSFQAFQELKFVAEQNRIGVDSLVDGIKELNLRADEFVVTGGGSAAEAFGRLGYSADQLKNKLKDPSALFTEIIGKLQQLDRAAQIRIADELFGGSGGEQFVQLIEQGEAGIKATIQEAHKLGTVMSDEVITRADELDRKFNALTTTVGTGLKTAIVEAAGALQTFINSFQGFWERHQQQVKAMELGALAGSMAGAKPDPLAVRTTPKTGRLPASVPPMPSQADLSAKYLANYRTELAKTNQERSIAAEAERIMADAAKKGLSVTKEQAEALAREKVARDAGEAAAKKHASARDKAGDRAAAEAKRVRELIADLEEELRLVGASDTQKEISATLRRANVEATSKEGQQISQLVTQIEAETAALEKQKEAQEARTEALSNMFEMGEDALTSMLDGSVKAEDAMKKLAVQIALAALQASLLGTGPLAGLFGGGGGLFGGSTFTPTPNGFANMLGLPGHAKGTANTGGARGDVRGLVHGQEAVIPLPNGGKVPVQIAGGASQDQAPMNFSFAPVYNVTGYGEDIAAMRRQMQKDRTEFEARTIDTVRKAQKERRL